MIGLDTNILVRYLVMDDKKQAEKASRYIESAADSGEQCFINVIVFCELIWVLESAYGYRKNEIADACENILVTKQFEFESKDLLRSALSEYRSGKADFADYLIGKVNKAKGCNHTISFDRSLGNQDDFIVLKL